MRHKKILRAQKILREQKNTPQGTIGGPRPAAVARSAHHAVFFTVRNPCRGVDAGGRGEGEGMRRGADEKGRDGNDEEKTCVRDINVN